MDTMRLDKLLSNMGYGSRKEVKKILKNGAVSVDGAIAKDGKTHVNPEEQLIAIHGEEVQYKRFVYFLMNKPDGVICATEDLHERTVVDLLDPHDAVFSPFPAGRLDKDTVGLVLLTNDGGLAHRLLSPKWHVQKTYVVRVQGRLTDRDVTAFQNGVTLDDGYVTKRADLVIVKSGDISQAEVRITEGKYHQIKRMFAALGKAVIFLKRVKMGSLELDDALPPGEYRELTKDEILSLM
jgi:16S rRNA pseudouridine516 synthase